MSKKRLDLHHIPDLPAEIAKLAEHSHFSGSERLAEAGRSVMAQHTKKLYAHLPGVLRGDDPHAIHQMRVATRRLRACLQATSAAYRPKRVAALAGRLRKLARSLGKVRDRDVLLQRLRAYVEATAKHTEIPATMEHQQTAEQQDELQASIDRLQGERDNAHAELVAELGRKRTQRLLQELSAFLTCPLEDVQADDDGLPLLVRHYAGSALWREYEAVRRFETVMPHASVERMHELRIATKHLRYTLELFEPALGEAAHGITKQVTALQEHLGNLHDADVAIAYLQAEHAPRAAATGSNSADGATPNPAPDQQLPPSRITAYIDTRTAERNELMVGVEPLWQQLIGNDTRSRLAQIIAAL